MAIIELWNSQEMRVTAEGTTITRIYKCTWPDALAGEDENGYALPKIGWVFSDKYPELKCADIDIVQSSEGGNNAIFTALFTTENITTKRKRREDLNESWEETFELFVEDVPVDNYLSYTAPADGKNSAVTEKKWAEVWEGSGGDPKKIPELTKMQGKASWSITVYGSSIRPALVLNHLAEVNSQPFLKSYMTALQRTEIMTDGDPDMPTFDDAGRWMFMGANITRVRPTCWRHDYVFVYNPNGWNTPIEIEGTNSKVTTNMYPSFDTAVLFEGMTAIDDVGEGVGTGQDTGAPVAWFV